MIFGYSPTKNRAEFKRRFSRKYSSTIYRNDFLFRRSKTAYITYAVIFWFLLILVSRIGLTAIYTIAPLSRRFEGLKLSLPQAFESDYHVIHKRYIKIWFNRSNSIVINNHRVEHEEISEFLSKSLELKKRKRIFLYIDKSQKMSDVNWLLSILKKQGVKKVVLVTHDDWSRILG